MTQTQDCLVFTGGGTAGHVYPALAVIEELRQRCQARIVWIGNKRGMDADLVRRAGIEFIGIDSGKFRRDLSARNLLDAFRVAAGYAQARALLRSLKPSLLFSKGGFVSVPPCLAARHLGIPYFCHESDMSPGLATRLSAKGAVSVMVAYPETAQALQARGVAASSIAVSGNPVRRAIYQGNRERGLRYLGFDGRKPVVLFLGGSQGALEVNQLVSESLPSLLPMCDIAHQTGKGKAGSQGPAQGGTEPGLGGYRSFEFLYEEHADVLAASDLVVGRSGAGSIWEAASLGKPMVLIPLASAATRGDQVLNAEYFAGKGAAIVMAGATAREGALASRISQLLGDAPALAAMSRASLSIAGPRATEVIASRLIEFLSRPKSGEAR